MRLLSDTVSIALDPASARRACPSDPVGCNPVRTIAAGVPAARAPEVPNPVTVPAAAEFWGRHIVDLVRLPQVIGASPARTSRCPEVLLNWLHGAALAVPFGPLSSWRYRNGHRPFRETSAPWAAGPHGISRCRTRFRFGRGRISRNRHQSLIGPTPGPTRHTSNHACRFLVVPAVSDTSTDPGTCMENSPSFALQISLDPLERGVENTAVRTQRHTSRQVQC